MMMMMMMRGQKERGGHGHRQRQGDGHCQRHGHGKDGAAQDERIQNARDDGGCERDIKIVIITVYV
jgi:hypothetical protein